MNIHRVPLFAFSLAHLRDSVAIAIAATPVYAWLEVYLLGLQPATSARVRLMTIAALFAGLALLLARGRDLSQRLLGVVPGRSAERTVLLHDMAFMVLANGLLAPLFYLASGAALIPALQGSAMAMGLSLFTGSLNGWCIDALRELSGSAGTRLPTVLRAQPPLVRGLAAAGLAGFSLMLVLAAYA